MTDSVAISAVGLGKAYHLYDRTGDRLREVFSLTRRKYGREVWALKDLSFEVPRGATFGMIGPNGAGKSTTLKILAGRLRPTTGTLDVRGRVSAILELGTGLQPDLTGRQNARVNGLFMGLDPWTVEDRLDQILAFSELGDYADQRLATYSSGMKARLAFSVLTALDPEVLVLDEALAAGDASFSQKCTEFIRALCRSGCTSVLVSHDLPFMLETCDRLAWIDHGAKRAEGRPADVVSQYLASVGQAADLRLRPKTLLLRIDAAEGERPTFLFSCVQWLSAAGALVEQHFPGMDAGRSAALEAASQVGFTPEAARAGWGEPLTHPGSGNPVVPLRPHEGPDGSAYLALPLPRLPRPFPAAVRVWGEPTLARPLTLSALVNGSFRALGTFGDRTPDENIPGDEWASRPYPLPPDLAGA